MRKAASSHFGLIGTDLFLNCFGAVFMMTILGPQHRIGTSGSDLAVSMVMNRAESADGVPCTAADWGGVSFAFRDRGQVYTAFDMTQRAPTPEVGSCQISGVLSGLGGNLPAKVCFVDPDTILRGPPTLYVGVNKIEVTDRCA